MVMTPANTKGTTPVTTGGRSSARPRSADAATKATASTPRSVKFDRVGDRDHGSDDDGSEDGLEMKGPRPILDDEEVDELTMVVGKSGAPRPIARRLGSEFDEVAPARALAPDERPTTGSRPPVNGDTPNAYKILGQVGRSMVATSAWMMMVGPKEVGGAKWVMLEKGLASLIDSSGLTQLAEQTKCLLEAMGFECAAMPSKLDGIDPSTVPLLSTPKKAPAGAGFQTPATKGDVFSTNIESPYVMDSHMITPKKSRGGRRINEDTDDEDDDDDYAGRDYADPCEDLAAQSAEDRYYTAKWDDDEHICDYLLRLNGYARSAKIMYETGGPAGARHVKRFLDSCEDDALVRQLITQRFDNIAKVQAVINDTMASDRRRNDRGNSSRQPCREGGRRNDSGRRDDRRGDGRGRREDRYSRQVTVAEASVDDLYDAWQSRLAITPRRRAVSDSGSDYSDRSCKSECESEGDYVDTAVTGRGNIGGRRDGQNRPHGFMGDGRRDEARRPRWGGQDRRARPEYGPCAACGDPRHSVHRCFRRCKFCTQVHRDGQCEHYKLYEDTVKFVKSKHDKDSLPSELQGIYSSNLNERARQL
ncbi:unnamed protein product [Phytophthora fragariaefolia]|uniref:Unnamed protein product n=1 Tax=Phytophthora fragariaefolia TaxID=1490495 RepID=A0A9W6XR22_9STRA|nr:unnamed protein product [Phytophthora fragariaefolia]